MIVAVIVGSILFVFIAYAVFKRVKRYYRFKELERRMSCKLSSFDFIQALKRELESKCK